ncbi:collagen-like protein [Providencia rettgeri]
MPKQQTVTLNFKTSDGKTLPASFVVTDGASTFELWKKQPGNEGKTEQQFLAEQKGPKGDTGAKGEAGAQGPKGDKGATGEKGAKGDTGAQGASIVSVEVQVKDNP